MIPPTTDLSAPPALRLPPGTLADPHHPDWAEFCQSWEDLPLDTWMADGGTYRRRRYAAFRTEGDRCERLPHRPHYQERDYNPLNGGVERWFAPMADHWAASPLLHGLVRDTALHIERHTAHPPRCWMVEAHQFRIEARPGHPGQPTPEGMHRDGRDWVLILLAGGTGFTGGITAVEDGAGNAVMTHRLSIPGEALLLDDRSVRHGTSPVETAQAGGRAWRDTLVLTFAATLPV